MQLNLPIILTLSRIALIPVLVLVFYLPFQWANIASVIVFVLASITDGLDGYMARRMGQTSSFGAFLDPVADKLMVATALVLLTQKNPTVLFALSAAIIIGREISISALREWMANLGEQTRVKVSWLGKVKTGFQMTAIGFLLYEESIGWLPVQTLGELLLYLAAALTLYSMVIYLRAAWPALTSQSQPLNADGRDSDDGPD